MWKIVIASTGCFAIASVVVAAGLLRAAEPDAISGATMREGEMTEQGSALRIMKAVQAHAAANGNDRVPVFSPWEVLLADGDPTTFAPSRVLPPPGLVSASSEIFDVSMLQAEGYPVVTWTVNDPARMADLMRLGVDGIISDRPDLLRSAAERFDPSLIGPDGLIDIDRLDIQGHRGARDLRPENTLPAMEAGLDHLVTTLETDTGVTADGVSVLSHDPYLMAGKCRRANGASYDESDEVLIKNVTVRELQSDFVCDGLVRDDQQANDLDLSPAAVAFADGAGLPHPYAVPTLAQLFDFVAFYADYYRSGAGASHDDAKRRWKNASRVRFNIETKLNPRGDRDEKGIVFADRTAGAQAFVNALAGTVSARGLQDRADIQSFDFRTLLLTHEQHPSIRTIFLFGDFPKIGDVGDGTNLQDENGENTPWLAGMFWPYRATSSGKSE